jgi:hypothetical protein
MTTLLLPYKTFHTFLLFFLLCPFLSVKAQQDSTEKITVPAEKVYSFRMLYGSILIHTPFIKNTAGAHPRGAEFEISKQPTDQKTWSKCNCYPRMGWTFSYFDFNTPILGRAYSASYFIEPSFRLGSNASFFVTGGGGLSYLTRPYDSLKNPQNHTYSLPVNFFLHLGAGFNFFISDKVSVGLMGSLEHNSNGDFSQPNRGINWMAVSLGLHYYTSTNKLPVYKRAVDKSWKKESFKVDAGIFYSPKAGYDLNENIKRKTLIGGSLELSKKVSQISALSIGTEIYYDGAYASIKKLISDSSSAVIAGVTFGHAFVFNRFIFSQAIGVYVHKKSETYTERYLVPFSTFYHRWGLRYKLATHWYAGISLMARANVADFIDMRVLYRF